MYLFCKLAIQDEQASSKLKLKVSKGFVNLNS